MSKIAKAFKCHKYLQSTRNAHISCVTLTRILVQLNCADPLELGNN